MTHLARYWRTGEEPSARSAVHLFHAPDLTKTDCGALVPEGRDLLTEHEPGVPKPPSRCKKCRWSENGKLAPEAVDISAELAGPLAVDPLDEAAAAIAAVTGIHAAVDEELYHRIKAASSHRLGLLKKSPAHLKSYEENPPERDSDALTLGTAFHRLVLERARFDDLYVHGPVDNRSLKLWKDCAAECDQAGLVPLRPKDWAAVHAMRDSIMAHPAARLAIEAVVDNELSILWDDPDTGVRCKARLDGLAPSIQAVVDVKTARDASEQGFARAAWEYGYPRQGAMNLDGIALLTGENYTRHVLVAVESAPPYAPQVFVQPAALIQVGREDYKRLLPLYHECSTRNEWPAYSRRFVPLSLPRWAWAELNEEWRSAS